MSRYIDADALIEKLPKEYLGSTVHSMINEAPTIEPKQGEWETEFRGNGWNDYLDYTCSNCGKKYERADAVLYKANFCPNCGARMKRSKR